jgi:hypothetical protein
LTPSSAPATRFFFFFGGGWGLDRSAGEERRALMRVEILCCR